MGDNEAVSKVLIDLYRKNDPVMNMSLEAFIRSSGMLQLPKEARILDCGCGMGQLMIRLRRHGFRFLTGVEACGEMADEASRRTGCPVVTTDVLEMDKHLPHGSADVVIFSAILHHLREKEQWWSVFEQARKVLKDGGMIFMREPFPTFWTRFFIGMSRYKVFHHGFMKGRLRDYIEERELHKYFFSEWPKNAGQIYSHHGFEVVKDFLGILNRVTVLRKK